MRLHTSGQLLHLRVVYWGAAGSGTTTNLERLHALFKDEQRGALAVLTSPSGAPFEYFPVVVSRSEALRVKVDFFSVPGLGDEAFRLVDGADGVVFVADRRPDRLAATLDAWRTLSAVRGDTPVVVQLNHSDAPEATSAARLRTLLEIADEPVLEAEASGERGVDRTHQRILEVVVAAMRKRLEQGGEH